MSVGLSSDAIRGGVAAKAASVARPRVLGWTLVVVFALLTWAGARVSIPLPFTPVPGTLQTVAVLLAGLFLGARGGAGSQLLYLAIGIGGLPVFALPGAGPGYLLGPTGGYLIGFVLAAAVAGRTIDPARRRFGAAGTVMALLAGSACIHLCGLGWLTILMGGDLAAALPAAFLPFALFDLTKIVLAAGLYTGAQRLRREGPPRWRRVTGR